MNNYQAATDAFGRGVELDPSNANLKAGLEMAKARIPKEEDDATSDSDIASESTRAADAPATGAGAGGLGGMPDLAGLLNNPMMMQMAQQMMQNGGLENLMSNPAVANMVRTRALQSFCGSC